MATFFDYFIPKPGRGITEATVLTEDGQLREYHEWNLDESLDDLLGNDLIVVYERPYYPYRDALPQLEHIMKNAHLKERWYDLFSELRKATGKQIALSKVVKGTLGDDIELKITRLGNSYGDPEYRPNLDLKMQDRIRALKELYDYIVQHDQVSYEQDGTTHWADITINESPELEDD